MKRITKIEINGLWGYLDHVIELKQKERVTIIHGPNGVGKTWTFRLIKAIFTDINKMPADLKFNLVKITFIENESRDKPTTHLIELNGKTRKLKPKLLPDFDIHFISTHRLYNILNSDDILSAIGSTLGTFTEEFTKLRSELKDSLISTMKSKRDTTEHKKEKKETRNPKVIAEEIHLRVSELQIKWISAMLQSINENIVTLINKAFRMDRLESFTLLSKIVLESIDTFSSKDDDIDNEFYRLEKDLENEFYTLKKDLEEIIDICTQASLIGQRSDLFEFKIDDKVEEKVGNYEERQKNVLIIYYKERLKRYENILPLAKKINLFLELINKKFEGKKIVKLNSESGFIVEDNFSNKEIPIEALSSGEQHQFFFLYKLIFDTKPNSLILIDEPEISMHLVWQITFIDDMLKIAEVAQIDFLIATHSPYIAEDHEDLMVPLTFPIR